MLRCVQFAVHRPSQLVLRRVHDLVVLPVLFPQFFEVRVFQGLFGCDPLLRVVGQEFIQQLDAGGGHVGQHLVEPGAFLGREVQVHVARVGLVLLQQVGRGGA